jgi:hypothetical protein
MAVTTYTGSPNPSLNSKKYAWLAVPNGNTGTPLLPEHAADYQDRTVQITGTFGTGGSVSIQGSNDGGTTWATLTDPLGNALTFTAAGMKQITELPEQIRPSVTAGDGTTSLNIYLFMRGDFR